MLVATNKRLVAKEKAVSFFDRVAIVFAAKRTKPFADEERKRRELAGVRRGRELLAFGEERRRRCVVEAARL